MTLESTRRIMTMLGMIAERTDNEDIFIILKMIIKELKKNI